MSNRVELSDEAVSGVVGGNIIAHIDTDGIYIYGSHNPDSHYGFSSYSQVQTFIADNYDLYGEMGTIQAMVAAGLCWPLYTSTTTLGIVE